MATDGVNGNELWKSEGTATGTVLVKDIFPGSSNSNPSYLTNANGTLYFYANDGTTGSELWKSDGTVSGTVLVKDIQAGSLGSYAGFSRPTTLTNVNGTVYFIPSDSVNGSELWKSDGTAAGTVLVKDIRPGANSSQVRFRTNVNGTLYFSANNGIDGVELWKSDGTAAGTILVKDVPGFDTGSNPSQLTNLNGTLYFSGWDFVGGFELWKSDGTSAGTVLVKDVFPGTAFSSITDVTNVNGTLYFNANDGVNGEEVWIGDGTSTGTKLFADVFPGSGGSRQGRFVQAGQSVFFSAFHPDYGTELWVVYGPTNVSLSSTSIPENSPANTIVGTLTTTDPDVTDTFTYSLVSGTGSDDNASFTVNPTTGAVSANFTFDSEIKNSYSIRVRTTDAGGLTFEQTFTINVTDVNESVVLTRANASVSGNVLTQLTNTGTWSDPESGAVTLSASLGTVTKNVDGTWSWSHTPSVALLGQVVTISATDGTNVSTTTFNVTAYTTIATRGIVYVGATGASASTSLATDKSALLPGQSSTFANYTNYSRGLNGLVIDLVGLPVTVTNSQLAASLQFADWNGIAAAGFVELPGDAVPTIAFVPGGVSGSTRVRITFPDNTVQNTWLRVTMLANADTALQTNDVFYFGNVIGELDFGNTATRLRVNGQDAALILANQSPGANTAGVTNKFDLDRNGRVNGQDYAILLANQQAAGIVSPITAPSARPAASRVSSDSSNVSGRAAPLPEASTNLWRDAGERQDLAFGTINGLLDKAFMSRDGEASANVAVIDLSGPATNSVKDTERSEEQISTGLDSIFASFWGRI
jgi:ELWxxDGT repeat protein